MLLNVAGELLSVIVPVYNTDKYLNECMESIINQTYKNMEIILVDDGSDDDSGKICDEYAKKDIRIKVIHQKNNGAVLARMYALKIAKGRYVTFVDSDDFIALDLFENLMQPLIDNKDVDISMSPITVYESGKYIFYYEKNIPTKINNYVAGRLIYGRKYAGWSLYAKIYKTKLFKNIRISNVTNAYGEDIEFNWKLLKKAKKVYYIPFSGYYYRQNSKSMMHKEISLARFGIFERLVNAFLDKEVKDYKLKTIIGESACNAGIKLINDYLKIKSDYYSIKGYQKLLRKIFFMCYKNLTLSEVKLCKMALFKGYKLHNSIKKKTNNIINVYMQLREISKNIFIYGAGLIGKDIASFLDVSDLAYIGFVVSKKNDKEMVFSLDEIQKKYKDDCAFLLAMNEKNTEEVKKQLKGNNYLCVGEYSIYY